MNICARFVCDWSQSRFPKSSNRPVITKKTMANRISLPFGWSWKLKNSNFLVVNYAWRVKTGFWFSFFVLSQSLFLCLWELFPREIYWGKRKRRVCTHTWVNLRAPSAKCEKFSVRGHCVRKTEIVRERKNKTRNPFWQVTRNLLPMNMSFTVFNFTQMVSCLCLILSFWL